MAEPFELGSSLFAGAALILIFLLIRNPQKPYRQAPMMSKRDVEIHEAREKAEEAAKEAAAEKVHQKWNEMTLADCNPQTLSPLFTTLPGELRNEVFRWALIQYEDAGEESRYRDDEYYCRPGFRGPHKSSTSLLRSCRLAWFEGSKVLMREAEHAFWFFRGPRQREGLKAFTNYFNSLTPINVRDLHSVRLFTQMYWIEGGGGLHTLFQHPKFRPAKLTVTFRYSDWWNWETDEELHMSEAWLARFIGTPELRQLVVEYETVAWKKAQMDPIIARNKSWKLQSADTGHFSAQNTALRTWTWIGSSRPGGVERAHHGGAPTMGYVVVEDTWIYVDTPMGEEDMAKVNRWKPMGPLTASPYYPTIDEWPSDDDGSDLDEVGDSDDDDDDDDDDDMSFDPGDEDESVQSEAGGQDSNDEDGVEITDSDGEQ